MNRRGFVGAALAGAGGFFLPQKLKANDKWWREKDFVFEGVSGTEFHWPRDRLIHLEEPDANKNGARQTILVPTFSILTVGGDLDEQMRAAIKVQKETDGDKYCGSHIHVIYIEGMPNQVGLMMFSKKCHPVTDCWADAEIREKHLLNRQRKMQLERKARKATTPSDSMSVNRRRQ